MLKDEFPYLLVYLSNIFCGDCDGARVRARCHEVRNRSRLVLWSSSLLIYRNQRWNDYIQGDRMQSRRSQNQNGHSISGTLITPKGRHRE